MRNKIIKALSLSLLSTASIAGTEITFVGSSNKNTIYKNLISPYNAYKESSENRVIGAGFGADINVEIKNSKGIVDEFKKINSKLTKTSETSPQNIDPLDLILLQDSLNNFIERYKKMKIEQMSEINTVMNFNINNPDIGVSFSAIKETGTSSGLIKGGNFQLLSTTDPTNQEFEGKAAMKIKNTILNEYNISLASSFDVSEAYKNSRLVYGVNFRYMSIFSAQKNIDLQDLFDPGSDKDITKELIEDAKDLTEGSFQDVFDVDLGLKFETPNYMVGVLVKHMLSPKIKVNDRTDPTSKFYGVLNKEVELSPIVRIESRLNDINDNWMVGAFYDLTESSNINGSKEHLAGVNLSYSTSSKDKGFIYSIIPDIRIGYKANLYDGGLSYYAAGITLGILNIDLQTSTKDFQDFIDNQSDIGLSGSASIELTF